MVESDDGPGQLRDITGRAVAWWRADLWRQRAVNSTALTAGTLAGCLVYGLLAASKPCLQMGQFWQNSRMNYGCVVQGESEPPFPTEWLGMMVGGILALGVIGALSATLPKLNLARLTFTALLVAITVAAVVYAAAVLLSPNAFALMNARPAALPLIAAVVASHVVALVSLRRTATGEGARGRL